MLRFRRKREAGDSFPLPQLPALQDSFKMQVFFLFRHSEASRRKCLLLEQ